MLTFGCGAVGGLMTRGAPADQERAVARAIEAGVNHFDTAALYGDGASEENLGRVLAALKPNVIVSTKVRLPASAISTPIAASLETSSAAEARPRRPVPAAQHDRSRRRGRR